MRILTFFLLFLLLLNNTAYANIKVESKVTSVTIYSDRAKVTRTATVNIKEGEQKIIFNNLPALLIPESLQVKGKSKANVKFGAVISKQIISSELTSEREKELNNQLEKFKDQIKSIKAEKKALKSQEEFIHNLSRQANLRANEDIAEINLKPEQWSSAAKTIYNEISSISKSIIQQEIKEREINNKIQATINELNRMRTGSKSTYEVTIPLESSANTNLEIKLSYQIRNVNWYPLYDARLNTKNGKMNLSQFGAVKQTTGEDWNNIKLTLSTAQPQRSTNLPEIQPMWVDIYYPEKESKSWQRYSSPNKTMGAPMALMDSEVIVNEVMAEDKLKRKAQYTTANINTKGFVSEYEIPGKISVKSDGAETKLMIGVFDTKSEMEIHVKPQIDNNAYLAVHSKLQGDAPILAGKVNLFRDGAYIGQSYMPLLRPSEEHILFFGIDDKISVTRRTIKDETTDAGVIMRDNIIKRHYITKIQNLHKNDVKVIVEESIPASKNDDINVEIISDATTPDYKKDAEDIKGLLQWSFYMKPKEEKKLKLGWKVTWPKDANLNGLR